MAASLTLEIPDVAYIVTHNMPVVWGILAIVGAAVLGSVLFQVYKTRKEFKTAEKLAKRAVAWGLVAFQTLTVSASYFLLIADDQKNLLQQLPYLGVYIPAATGVARTLYDLGLNKTYKTVADWLANWSKPKGSADIPALNPATQLPVEQPAQIDPLS